MIGYIKGKVKYKSDSYLIIESQGVGYKLEVVNNYLKIGQDSEFYVHTYLRENEIRLFGFESIDDLVLFEMLIDISGIGPKGALALLKKLGTKDIINSILIKDSDGLKAPGIGDKSAKKIVLELQEKLEKKGYKVDSKTGKASKNQDIVNKKLNEAKEALSSLGYSQYDIRQAIDEVKKSKIKKGLSVEQLVKLLLQKMQ